MLSGAKAYSTRFWMLHHGGLSSKRTVFYGNLSSMNMLDKGTLSRQEREAKTSNSLTRLMLHYGRKPLLRG